MAEINQATAPAGLSFVLQGSTWSEVDAELHQLANRYRDKAARARAQAKRHRARGDLVRWRQANAVARAWEMAAGGILDMGCPF